MTREEINNFNYNAMVELAKGEPKVREAVEKAGYNTESPFFFVDFKKKLGFNGKFKLAMRRVYQEVVLPDDELLSTFKDLSIMLPK